MGILSRLVEQRSAGFSVSDNLPDDHWFFRWLGNRTESGVIVNEATALNTLMVVTCVMILADTFASVPLQVFRRMEPRGRDTARRHPLYRVLHDEPNPDMSSFTWRHVLMTHLATWGNHYSEIIRRGGEVVALRPFHPSDVQLREIDGELVYEVNRSSRRIASRNMLHLRGLSTRGYLGLSPLTMMRQAVGIAVAAEEYGARFFANDARPSILLKHPLTLSETAKKNLIESWNERNAGHNRGGVDVLEEGMEVETISIPPDDAQFIQTRQFESRQLAGFYRIPPHLISDVDRSTSWGTGIEQQQIGFTTYTMQPWFVRVEQEIHRQLFQPDERDTYYAEFNVDGLLRGDSQARGEFYDRLWRLGAFSPNDIREKENMNPIPGGDRYYVPLNTIPVDRLDEETEPEPESEPEPPADDELEEEGITPRERRSAEGRRRLANAHRTIFRDTAAGVLRIETQEVRAMIRRVLLERGPEAFSEEIKRYYYEEFPPKVRERMMAPVRTLMDVVAIDAAEEIGADPPDAERLDAFAEAYVEVYALRHCGDSRSRVLARVNAHRDAGKPETRQSVDELGEELEDELDSWPERADGIAQEETHRSGNATALEVFAAAGILSLRWVAAGAAPCEFCQAMDGRVTNIDTAFLAAGSSLKVGGLAAMLMSSTVRHPPLHKGCECIIVPG